APMADLDAAGRDDQAPARARALSARHAAGPDEPARPARPLYLPGWAGHALPPARQYGRRLDRPCRVERLRSPALPGRHRPLRARARRHADPGPAVEVIRISR